MPESLPPLPPGDYSRSAQDRHYEESMGWKRNRGREHRALPDIPFWTAPSGYCRWCGEDTGARLKNGDVDHRVRWHGRCSAEYNSYHPAAQRDRLWDRETGLCASCLRFCPKRETTRPEYAEDLRARYREPHDVTHYRRWACDHIVPLIDGGANADENLQLLCEPCHKAKTAAEAGERAARRRGATEPPVAEVAESDQLSLLDEGAA